MALQIEHAGEPTDIEDPVGTGACSPERQVPATVANTLQRVDKDVDPTGVDEGDPVDVDDKVPVVVVVDKAIECLTVASSSAPAKGQDP